MNKESKVNFETIVAEETPFAHRLAAFIKDIIQPSSVLDIGCGPGHFVYAMRYININAQGLDIDDRIKNLPYLSCENLLTTKLFAETAICLEVFEHIPNEYGDALVDKVSSMFTKNLIFTAAQPGQGGVGHINCQVPEYWSSKFLTKGLRRNFLMERVLRWYCDEGVHMGWFYNNLLVFSK